MDKATPISKFLSARENQSWRVSPESRPRYEDSFLQNDSFFDLSPSSSFSPRKRKRFSTGESEVEMERDMRMMKSELIESKTKIGKLESLLEEASNKYEERLINYEKEDVQLKSENRFLNEKIRLLEDQKKKSEEREGERGQLLLKEKEYSAKKATSIESKLRNLQIENFELLYKYQKECMEWKDKERKLNEKVEEIKHGAEKWIIDTQMQEEQLTGLKSQLVETKKLLEVAEEKANRYSEQQQAINKENADKESSIKNLENRFVSQQIEIKKFQAQIVLLTEANSALKTSINREHILETEVSSLLRKVEWLNAEMKKMRFFEMERDELKEVLKSWEEVAMKVDPSNTTPSHFQAFLRKTQNLLIELKHENTNLQSGLQKKEAMTKTMEKEASFHKAQIKDLIDDKEKLSYNLKKLNKRLSLITKDRDGLQSLKESYEAEYTGLITEPLQKRIAQLEETIKEYEILVAQEEVKKNCPECEEKLSIILSLQKELDTLKQQNENLREEMKAERSTTERGDETVRVVSFGNNPSLKSLDDRVKELAAENEKLKEELKGKSTISSLKSPFANKEDQAAEQEELAALQLKNQELQVEISQEKAFLFNIMCKLFGFRINIDREPNTLIHLNSIYYQPEENEFVFQAADNGDMILLQTSVLDNFQTEIQEFLVEQASIPAFLSAITITCARELPNQGLPITDDDPNDSQVTVDQDDDESEENEEDNEVDEEEVEDEEDENEPEHEHDEDSDGSDIIMLED